MRLGTRITVRTRVSEATNGHPRSRVCLLCPGGSAAVVTFAVRLRRCTRVSGRISAWVA